MVVTAFLTGWPSIIAVILNYVKRSEVRATWLDSHFAWQIRTFWFALLWLAIGGILFITVVGIPSRSPCGSSQASGCSTASFAAGSPLRLRASCRSRADLIFARPAGMIAMT